MLRSRLINFRLKISSNGLVRVQLGTCFIESLKCIVDFFLRWLCVLWRICTVMLLQKLLSFCQSFVIRLLGCGGLSVLFFIRNKLAVLLLHEVRIRRIAIRVRSNRSFFSSRAICRTVLFNTFFKLGGVSLVLVKLFTCIIKVFFSFVYLFLRCTNFCKYLFCFVKCFAIFVICLLCLRIFLVIRSRAISFLEHALRSVLKRWAWMRIRILVN